MESHDNDAKMRACHAHQF